jgi:hypothetical protein
MVSKINWSFMHYLGLYFLAIDSSDGIPTRPNKNKVLYLRDTKDMLR